MRHRWHGPVRVNWGGEYEDGDTSKCGGIRLGGKATFSGSSWTMGSPMSRGKFKRRLLNGNSTKMHMGTRLTSRYHGSVEGADYGGRFHKGKVGCTSGGGDW